MDACAVPDFCIFDRPFCKKVNFLWKVKITSIDPSPALIPHFIQRVLVVLRFMKCHPNTFHCSYIKNCCSFYKFFTIPFLFLPLKNWIVKRSDIHLSFILNGIPKVNRRQPEKKCTRKQKQNNSRVGFHLKTYSFILIVISSIFIWQLVKSEMDSAILSLISHQIMCSMMLALAILDDNQNI